MSEKMSKSKQEMIDLLDKHVAAELRGDLEETMNTMIDEPHLFNVPVRMGGVGKKAVREFYANHLVGKFFPPDVKMNRISLTVGADQIIEELVISFTHTVAVEWMLPNIAPTNKPIEVALVVIAGVKDGKISHEHIYWDQATVLVQIGLLDPKNLPVIGVEGARRIADLKKV